MAMSKKHYNALANAIKSELDLIAERYGAGDETTTLIRNHIAGVAGSIATICKQDNAAFDKERFLNACGVQ
jgi:hypothetical protein